VTPGTATDVYEAIDNTGATFGAGVPVIVNAGPLTFVAKKGGEVEVSSTFSMQATGPAGVSQVFSLRLREDASAIGAISVMRQGIEAPATKTVITFATITAKFVAVAGVTYTIHLECLRSDTTNATDRVFNITTRAAHVKA
jgi:hypothetical protein